MNIGALTAFFMRRTIINGGLLILWAALCAFASDSIYRIQGKWFPLPRETFHVIMCSLLGLFKIAFLVLNVVPYAALLIVG